METLQLSNIPFRFSSPAGKLILVLLAIISVFLIFIAPGLIQAIISVGAIAAVAAATWFMIEQARVGYTLTRTHFQQHLYRGGWVLRWHDIQEIGVCTCNTDGWHQPLPWIGIRIKDYGPYLESICPRVATQILLEQRALLYLGCKQAGSAQSFEDIVLDSHDYIDNQGKVYTGLQAMLANRMRHQRAFFGYDLFIAASDLDRDIDEFVGLTRRYLAAAPDYDWTDSPDQ